MSSTSSSFSDEELIRYLDDTLSPARAEQVQDALAGDPGLSGRLASLAVDTNEIRQAFDDTLQAAPEMSLDDVLSAANTKLAGKQTDTSYGLNHSIVQSKQVPGSQNRGWRYLAMAASLLVAAGAGLLLGQQWQEQRVISNNWQTAVIQYHDLYALETLPGEAPSAQLVTQQLAAISSRSGRVVSAEMVDLPGLQFRRAQTLTHQGRVLIQLAFLSKEARPVVLCFMQTGAPDSLPVADSVDGMDTVSWARDGFEFILAGKQSGELLAAAVPAATTHF